MDILSPFGPKCIWHDPTKFHRFDIDRAHGHKKRDNAKHWWSCECRKERDERQFRPISTVLYVVRHLVHIWHSQNARLNIHLNTFAQWSVAINETEKKNQIKETAEWKWRNDDTKFVSPNKWTNERTNGKTNVWHKCLPGFLCSPYLKALNPELCF